MTARRHLWCASHSSCASGRNFSFLAEAIRQAPVRQWPVEAAAWYSLFEIKTRPFQKKAFLASPLVAIPQHRKLKLSIPTSSERDGERENLDLSKNFHGIRNAMPNLSRCELMTEPEYPEAAR